jgi:hypothetical protein
LTYLITQEIDIKTGVTIRRTIKEVDMVVNDKPLVSYLCKRWFENTANESKP